MNIIERFVLPQAGMFQSRSHQGLLLLPLFGGDPLVPSYWSPDGVSFSEVKLDVGGLGDAPVLRRLNGRPGAATLPSSHALFTGPTGALLGLEVGPTPRIGPIEFSAPGGTSFVRHDVHRDETGRWWAAGHDSREELHGLLFTSEDGKTWAKVAGTFDGLKHLIPTAGGLRALGWKHVYAVTAAEVTKHASMRTHLSNALFTPALTLTVGEGELGVLSQGAKRAKYQPCPEFTMASVSVHLATDGAGFWAGGASGLSYSRDGLVWTQTPLREQVCGLHLVAGQLLAHTLRAVYAVSG